jgi:putative ABC transport system permease protein
VFTRLFPDLAGYRMVFVRLDPDTRARATEIMATLEDRLDSYGLDLQTTTSRLESYHRVENTYLSTFQALGGLGLVLGTLGLAAVTARNVVERRRELALVSATGFDARRLQLLVASEQVVLVAAGLAIGLVAAGVAIAPVLVQRGAAIPSLPLAWIGAVLAVGLLSAAISTRAIRRLPLVASLRSE